MSTTKIYWNETKNHENKQKCEKSKKQSIIGYIIMKKKNRIHDEVESDHIRRPGCDTLECALK